jgi:hypothetical protein
MTGNPILVTGAHRTGTTWVGKMLSASGEAAYISEPLNHWHRPGVLSAPVPHWYEYICAENEAAFLPAMRQMLAFRYHLGAELLSLRSRKDIGRMGRDLAIFTRGRLMRQRPLLKDPFALFSIPWFIEHLGCQVVVTVRHPAGFASSLKRLNWPFEFQDLLDQPLLIRDHLEPFRAEMVALRCDPPDIIAQASLLWRMTYQTVQVFQQRCPGIQVVRHEDLSMNPPGGFRKLYAALDLSYTERSQQTILSSSSGDNPGEVSKKAVHAVRLDSRANLDNWKRRLQPEEIARIRALTEDTCAVFYPDMDWEPS